MTSEVLEWPWLFSAAAISREQGIRDGHWSHLLAGRWIPFPFLLRDFLCADSSAVYSTAQLIDHHYLLQVSRQRRRLNSYFSNDGWKRINLRIIWDDSKLTRLSIRFPPADLTPLRCPFSFPCLAETQWHTIQSCHPDDRRPTTSPHVGGRVAGVRRCNKRSVEDRPATPALEHRKMASNSRDVLTATRRTSPFILSDTPCNRIVGVTDLDSQTDPT